MMMRDSANKGIRYRILIDRRGVIIIGIMGIDRCHLEYKGGCFDMISLAYGVG
jgi:hypothetical protein